VELNYLLSTGVTLLDGVNDGVGVTTGITEDVGVIDGVGVTELLGVTEGVTLLVAVTVTLGVAVGVTLIETVIVGVAVGVTELLGVIEGVGVGETLSSYTTTFLDTVSLLQPVCLLTTNIVYSIPVGEPGKGKTTPAVIWSRV
jgi:hypothetical protein